MKRLMFFLMTACIAAAPAAYAQMKYLAVVEMEVDEASGALSKINRAEVRQITAEIRGVAVKNLPREKYNVMTSETVMAQGSARLEECSEENCVIALGSMIGADYIVRGIISMFGTSLTMAVEMYETIDGNLVASSGLVRSETTAGLLDKISAVCADMFKTFVSSRRLAPKAPAAYTVAADINPPGGGAVLLSPNQASYAPGTKVSVTAKPAKGYVFAGWSGASTSTNAKFTASIDRDLTLTANFHQKNTPPPAARPHAPAPAPAPAPTPTPIYKQSGAGASETLVDTRDGKEYRTAVIGGMRWMAENLNYDKGKSWCYGKDKSNCGKYGRLYDWKTAKTACPSGYHLPSREEWGALAAAAGGTGAFGVDGAAGAKLKARSGWNGNGNGTDDFGFSALPSGGRNSDGYFVNIGGNARWWTSTERGDYNAYRRGVDYNLDYMDESSYFKSYGYAVRCVAD